MLDAVVSLVPLTLAATLVPVYPIVVLLLLQSRGGLRAAIAFVAGSVAVRLAQGVVFGLVFSAAAEARPEDGPQVIASALLLVLGIMLLVAAYKKWQKQEDTDDPPAWMRAISGLSTVKALGAGALYVAIAAKQWVFTLTAIDLIAAAGLGRASGAGAYLIYTLATQVLVLAPIVVFAVAPQQAAGPLQAALGWLERNNRPIAVAVSLIFGLWFLYKGVTGLIA